MARCKRIEQILDSCLSPVKKSLSEASCHNLAEEMASSLMDEELAEIEQLRRDLEAAHCKIDNLSKSLATKEEDYKALLDKNGELQEKHAALTTDFQKLLKTYAEETRVAHERKEELLERISVLTNLAQEKEGSLRVQQTHFELERVQLERRLESAANERQIMAQKLEASQQLLAQKERTWEIAKLLKEKELLLSKKDEELAEVDVAPISQLEAEEADPVSGEELELPEESQIIEEQVHNIQEKTQCDQHSQRNLTIFIIRSFSYFGI